MTRKGADKMGEIEEQMLSKLSQIRQILEKTPGLLCSPGQQVQNGGSINKQGPGHEVVIFSMEVMDPGWLKAALNSRFFNRWVNKSKYTISKDKKKNDSISESTFCIFLTHQFVWNVMSSSEKAQELKELGSKPFIVVIDDADDSGDEKKKKLLNDLIINKIYIKDLFLFSKLEKECDFITYLNNDDQTDSMPIGKDPLVSIQAMPTQDRQVITTHTAHMMGVDASTMFIPSQYRHITIAHATHKMGVDTLTMVPVTPDQYRHVSTAHSTYMMGPLLPNHAVPNPDRHVNKAPAAHMTREDRLALFVATPNPNKPVSSYHAAHMMGPLLSIHAVPNLDRHVNKAPVAHMKNTQVLVPAMPDQDRHVSTQHVAPMMGVNILAPPPATLNPDRPVSSYHAAHPAGVKILAPPPATLNLDRPASSHHAAHPVDDGMFTPASTIKEGHGNNNSHPAHTMGEELLVEISPTSSHERFNNSSCPTQIVGKDLLLSIPSIARQRRCAKTSSPANVMGKYNNQDPPVAAPSTPNQLTSLCTSGPRDVIGGSYSNEPNTNISIKQPPGKKHIIGIFSRSSKEDYSWLVELLTSENYRDSIQDVKPCYISSNGFQRFIDDLSQCTFGILYHTKNRGRVNITNVTDSLYDEELECLEQMLGKDNVIVVIDDLEDNSDQEKERILENQPDIKRLASDLLLISCTKKKIQLESKLKSVIQ